MASTSNFPKLFASTSMKDAIHASFEASSSHGVAKGLLVANSNSNRGTKAVKSQNQNNSHEENRLREKGKRPMPDSLLDTPIGELSDGQFLRLCKAEAANLTPREFLIQKGFVHQFMVGTLLVTYTPAQAQVISKAKARKIRRAANKKARMAAL